MHYVKVLGQNSLPLAITAIHWINKAPIQSKRHLVPAITLLPSTDTTVFRIGFYTLL